MVAKGRESECKDSQKAQNEGLTRNVMTELVQSGLLAIVYLLESDIPIDNTFRKRM